MSYSIAILRRAQKELSAVHGSAYERLRDAIRALANDPLPAGYIKLTGRDGYRIRVGDYRVIYEIDHKEQIVTVFHIGHRRDVYR